MVLQRGDMWKRLRIWWITEQMMSSHGRATSTYGHQITGICRCLSLMRCAWPSNSCAISL